MIFCKDVLFVHVPKAGGMSVTRHLLQVLPRPVYYSIPPLDEKVTDTSIVQIPGIRHETLEEARRIVREYGYEILQFPLILAVVRNPYAIEVSRYKFLQQDYQHPNQGYNQQLAMEEDFETFAIKSSYHGGETRPLESYFLLDGRVPPNLQIIRFENLLQDLKAALQRVGIEKVLDFPHLNRSHHADFRLYYTQRAEEAVYQKYKWAFDSGLYERFDLGDAGCLAPLKQELKDLKEEFREFRDRTQEVRRLNEAYHELERWAHELEATVLRQEATARAYQLWLAPITLLRRVGLRLKGRV
jgi:hypothetical protein